MARRNLADSDKDKLRARKTREGCHADSLATGQEGSRPQAFRRPRAIVVLLSGLLFVWCTPAFASFNYKAGPFTVQSGKMPSSQTDFPFCIHWTDTSLKTTGNVGGQVTDAQGDDIVPYSDSSLTTPYSNFQMVYYDGTNGKIEMCIKTTGGVGTTVYLGIGDSGITTFQGNAEAAWNSNFKAVYHLGNGATLNADDSTSNNADGSITGATAAAGKIGGAASFAGGTDKVDMGDVANADFGTDAFTISFWMKTSAASDYVVSKRAACEHGSFWNLVTGGIEVDEDSIGTNYGVAAISGLNNNVWRHLVATRSGTSLIFYVDGSAADSETTAGTTNLSNSASLILGNNPCGSYTGLLDEVRISKGVARSADWIASEYNNMADMAAFWGSPSFAPVQAGTSRKEYFYLGDRILAVETTNQP